MDRLQLPESERASLAAEENVIAELRRRLDDTEGRCAEVETENEDLKQEVRDLQLEMEGTYRDFSIQLLGRHPYRTVLLPTPRLNTIVLVF